MKKNKIQKNKSKNEISVGRKNKSKASGTKILYQHNRQSADAIYEKIISDSLITIGFVERVSMKSGVT